jgi:DNA-binding transcriptional ArsR family regulator
MTAGEIADNFEITKPTLSRHFAVLKEADLIHGDKVRTTITYHLNVSVLEDALVTLIDTFDLLRRKGEDEGEDRTASETARPYRNQECSCPRLQIVEEHGSGK